LARVAIEGVIPSRKSRWVIKISKLELREHFLTDAPQLRRNKNPPNPNKSLNSSSTAVVKEFPSDPKKFEASMSLLQ